MSQLHYYHYNSYYLIM